MKGILKRATALFSIAALCVSTCGSYLPVQAAEMESESAVMYQVTIKETEHGTIKVNKENARYEANEIVEITVDSKDGYDIDNLNVLTEEEEEINLTKVADGYSFVMPTKNVRISGRFEEVEKHPETVMSETQMETQIEIQTESESEVITEVETETKAENEIKEASELETESMIANDWGDATALYYLTGLSRNLTSVVLSQNGSYGYKDAGFSDNAPSLTAPYNSTGHYMVTYKNEDGEKETKDAFCINPNKPNPSPGNFEVSKLSDKSNLAKAIFYGVSGPKGFRFFDEAGEPYSSMTKAQMYILTHVVASRFNNDSDWSAGLNSKAIKYANAFYDWVKDSASVPDSSISFSKDKLTASIDPNDKTRQVSETVKLNGSAMNYITITVPSDTKLHDVTNNKVYSAGEKVEIYGKTSVYFSRPLESAQPLTFTKVYKGKLRENTIYKLKTSDSSLQDMVFIFGEAAKDTEKVTLNLEWMEVEGKAKIKKVSANPEITNGNNCYSLEGATFKVTKADTKEVMKERLVTDASGESQEISLSAGKYVIEEEKAPKGFVLDSIPYTIEVKAGEVTVCSIKNLPVNDPIGLLLKKVDAETGNEMVVGNGTFEGAEYTIKYYDGQYKVENLLNNIQPIRTWVLKTNKDGKIQFRSSEKIKGDDFYYDILTGFRTVPLGTITIQETKAPVGYKLDNTLYIRNIEAEADTGKLITSYQIPTSPEPIIRGGVKIEKWDNEINSNIAQGSASLENTTIQIINRSVGDVIVENVTYATGEVVKTVNTDENGIYQSSNNLLPYGLYEAVEVSPPAGYLPTGKLKQSFEIREDGVIVELTGDNAIKNDPIRGDLKGVKISDGDGKRMANIPFKITSMTTGESHVIITDENGQFDTSSCWNPHSHNTNKGETSDDGIWFGNLDVLDDTKGALLYDQYEVEEQSCEANADRVLIPVFTVKIKRNMTTVDLGTLTNDYVPKIEIGTTAKDKETGSNVGYVNEKTTIIDTVSYINLVIGKEYTIKGVLMDKKTEKPLLNNGKEVTVEKIFKAEKANGYIDIEFVFDSSALKGKEVVAFENLYFENREIAVHADIEDKAQTVKFEDPKVSTTATDKSTGEHIAHSGKKTTVIDVVKYENLIPNKEYTVKGVLMDKETGKPLMVNDKEVRAEKTFIAVSTSGSIEIEFIFNSSALKGKEVVVFENLYFENREIAVHANIEDKSQTVSFERPYISTTAKDSESGEHTAHTSEKTTVIDVVRYDGLIPGKEYTVKGVLMEKETGKALYVNGSEVTAEKNFVAENSKGSIEIEFIFDSSALKGKEVVAFETLYTEGKEITSHSDIEDKSQTIKFTEPKVSTKASEKSTGSKEITVNNKVTVVDEIKYEGLIPGKEYTVKGVLMDKKTEKPLLNNGKEITAEKTFKAEKSAGSIEVEFVLNASALAGKEAVVFETLYYNDREIAVHADINDKAQTVKFVKIQTETPVSSGKESVIKSPKTGDNTQLILWGMMFGVSAIGAIGAYIYKRKKTAKIK